MSDTLTDLKRPDDPVANMRALRAYFDQHGPVIRQYVYRKCKDNDKTEEVTIKAFFALWDNRKSLTGDEQVRPFLIEEARKALDDKKDQDEDQPNDLIDARVISGLAEELAILSDNERAARILEYLKRLSLQTISDLVAIYHKIVGMFYQYAA